MRRPVWLLLPLACASNDGRSDMTVETDGAWVRAFATDRETAYHAALAVLRDRGWTFHATNPLGGSFTAKSPVRSIAGAVSYRLAHVVVESRSRTDVRIRIGMVRTYEPSGGGRRPNNDRPVRDRDDYAALFDEIAAEIAR